MTDARRSQRATSREGAALTQHVRHAYASRAEEYGALLGDVAALAEEDRRLIADWATTLTGPVLDVGCGPGQWTAFLHGHGVDVSGIDLVPEFVDIARARFPELPVTVGDAESLPAATGALAGILSWYSLIHAAPETIPVLLEEFARALRPGGTLLVGFFRGARVEPFEHAVVRAWFWPVDVLAARLELAGFDIVETHARTDPGQRPHAAILARRRP